MTNYEKYKDEIIDIISTSNSGIALVRGRLEKCFNVEDCDNCDFNIGNCADKCSKWLKAEYKEPTVDWSKVSVDTPILVSFKGVTWLRRYFAKYEDGYVFAFDGGSNSWSNSGNLTRWTYAKLADEVSE